MFKKLSLAVLAPHSSESSGENPFSPQVGTENQSLLLKPVLEVGGATGLGSGGSRDPCIMGKMSQGSHRRVRTEF